MDTETITELSAEEIDHRQELLARAKRWAALHSNPKTRSKMDQLLLGLSEADQRKVYLDGQRISKGMQPKHIEPKPKRA